MNIVTKDLNADRLSPHVVIKDLSADCLSPYVDIIKGAPNNGQLHQRNTMGDQSGHWPRPGLKLVTQ